MRFSKQKAVSFSMVLSSVVATAAIESMAACSLGETSDGTESSDSAPRAFMQNASDRIERIFFIDKVYVCVMGFILEEWFLVMLLDKGALFCGLPSQIVEHIAQSIARAASMDGREAMDEIAQTAVSMVG